MNDLFATAVSLLAIVLSVVSMVFAFLTARLHKKLADRAIQIPYGIRLTDAHSACWGADCKGNYSTVRPEARCKLVLAAECQCRQRDLANRHEQVAA